MLATPYSSDDIPDLKRTQSADVMTLTHPDHPPYDLTRTDHNAWTITEVDFAPNVLPPSGVPGCQPLQARFVIHTALLRSMVMATSRWPRLS
jgi:hypothetical protein